MNTRAYLKSVSKQLNCSKKLSDKFLHDLETDISSSLESGDTWDAIEKRLGEPRIMAREFNDSLTDTERMQGQKRRRRRVGFISAAGVVAALVVLTAMTWWMLPHVSTKQDEENNEVVIDTAKKAVGYIDSNNFDALQNMMDASVQQVLTPQRIKSARATLGDDWGSFISFGNSYERQVQQQGQTVDLVELNAAYQNTAVTYTLCFNTDLKLIGFYLK